MNRPFLVCALLAAASAALGAQNASQTASQPGTYQGVSHPPSDDVIVTTSIPEAKPQAGQPAAQPAAVNPPAAAPMPAAAQDQPRPASLEPSASLPVAAGVDGTDAGVVGIAPPSENAPQALSPRTYAYDPDGDIVHVQPLRPGELQEGTSIRVRLLDRLSTWQSQKGEPFRTRVATDVMQGSQVLIPAGAEIDGRVVQVSSGKFGGHGTMRLQPDDVILPDGTRYHLHAAVTGAPGSHARVVDEGIIRPNSRVKRAAIEYGVAVGAGAATGAIVGGPAGALTGGLIGAGAITVHLLVNHPQAVLEPGSTLTFMLTDRLYLAPEAASGS